jgi:hypothetical protein
MSDSLPPSPPPSPPSPSPPPPPTATTVDEELLRELTGQTEVSEPDHARALLGIAQRAERVAREEHEQTRWPLRRTRFRMLPVVMRLPPLIAALVVTSMLIFALAMLLIMVHLAGPVGLIALVSLGYTIGFGVILYLLNDGPGENDQNRAAVRRRALQAAIDARVASAAKVMRLEREARAAQELIDRVVTYGQEAQRRRRQEQQKQQRPNAKSPARPDPREPEYGGG